MLPLLGLPTWTAARASSKRAGRALQSSYNPVQEWLRGLRTFSFEWSGLAWSHGFAGRDSMLVTPGRSCIGAARPDVQRWLTALAELG